MNSSKIIRIVIYLTFISCTFLVQTSLVYANNPGYLDIQELKSFGFVSYQIINPNLLVYPIKRLFEEIRFATIFDKQMKKRYLFSLYEVRLDELIFIVNNKKEGFIPFVVDRHNTFVGRLKKYGLIDRDLKIKFQNYIKLLERLRDIYPANSLDWSKLQQTVDTVKTLL